MIKIQPSPAIAVVRPYTPLTVISSSEKDLVSFLEETHIAIALELNTSLPHADKDVLKQLIEGNNPFLLLIHDDGNTDGILPKEIVEIIELCLFSSNYIQVDEIPVIAFIKRSTTTEKLPGDSTVSGQLSSFLKKQGWHSIKEWKVYAERSFSRQLAEANGQPLLLTHIDFDARLISDEFFRDNRFIGNYLFFKGNSLEESLLLEQEFLSICQVIVEEGSFLESCIKENMALKIRLRESHKKNKVLQERLNNAETTIEIIKSKYKDDYDNLFKWYHQEYEILPLWFKRLGHIVKVFTGKRAFLSLFSDNVKKYKS
jgi:regulator of replication initiation timing